MTIKQGITYVLVGLALTTASCKSGRNAQAVGNAPNIKSEVLFQKIDSAELSCDWLSIKYDVEIKTPKLEDSFKMYIRLKQDSVIWVSATYYAVEVARFLFTPDTLKFMDRRNSKYFVGDYSYLNERFKVDANYEILESLILANSKRLLQIEDGEEKFKTNRDDGQYRISFLRKGQVRRALRRDEDFKEIDLNVSLWFDPSVFRISRAEIEDFESSRNLTAIYSNYEKACNSSFPFKALYIVESENEQVKVNTSVLKLSSGDDVTLSFTIPEKYEALAP